MYELSVALKYLTPRWRQLSVSIISLISILVISLVVWLIVVFFSVTLGLEKTWTQKLIAITAPIRVTPTDDYYRSYYYLADSISSSSNYALKSIGEKKQSLQTDPYNPLEDEETPADWQKADRDKNGHVKDLVKSVFDSVGSVYNVSGLTASDYEVTTGNIRLKLIRPLEESSAEGQLTESILTYAAYIGSFDPNNPILMKTILPLTASDVNNIVHMSVMGPDAGDEHDEATLFQLSPEAVRERLINQFDTINVVQLQTPKQGWALPKVLWPEYAVWKGYALAVGKRIIQVVLPKDKQVMTKEMLESKGVSILPGTIEINNGYVVFSTEAGIAIPLKPFVPLMLEGDAIFSTHVDKDSLRGIEKIEDLQFSVDLSIQGVSLKGNIPLENLIIYQADTVKNAEGSPSPLWVHQKPNSNSVELPKDPYLGDGILLPKSFRDAGILLGDSGYLSYLAPTASSMQEQRIHIYVAGFYDHGIIPIGGKFILARQEIVSSIRAAQIQEGAGVTNGINVRFDDLDQVDQVKESLRQAFIERGIDRYWNIGTFREFEFTKDLLQQLRSEKNLWMLIASVIIIVACSNIISMLIILVNDKKLEIGILRSMGATSFSISLIFGFCGIFMGVTGSAIGIAVAVLTLKHLQQLIDFIGMMQGYEMFNPHFYGGALPNDLSFEAIVFVIGVTAVVSLIAGIVPAVKACTLKPSHILRSE